jgi:serine/threonine protein phosphatase PrpC
MFDSVYDIFTCPHCHASFELEAQIHYGFCYDHQLRPGDEIIWLDPRGREHPQSDQGKNVGGQILVQAFSDTECPQCGKPLPETAVMLQDNVIQKAFFTEQTIDEQKQLAKPTGWFDYWSKRIQGTRNEDRLEVYCSGKRWTLALADGAGGTTGGTNAACGCTSMAASRGADGLLDAAGWCSYLSEIDQSLAADQHAGESTLVVLQISDGFVEGASVGDSEAWMVSKQGVTDLTQGQKRKPLLGSGKAQPVPIPRQRLDGRLVMGSDGLFKYLDRARLCRLTSSPTLRQSIEALERALRLPSGAFHDDAAMIVGSWIK